MSENEQSVNPLFLVLGIFITLLCGFLAILAGVYVTHSAEALWALIPIAWMLEEVHSADDYTWHPTARGMAMGLFTLLIGAVVLFLHQAEPLWALFFVAFLVDDLV